jgi:hypothetical protein
MKSLYLKTSLFVWSLLMSVVARAQDDDDDQPLIRGFDDGTEMDMDSMDYIPIHFSFSDILMVLGLLVACYLVGKVWKGCSYLLLIAAALIYYLSRH